MRLVFMNKAGAGSFGYQLTATGKRQVDRAAELISLFAPPRHIIAFDLAIPDGVSCPEDLAGLLDSEPASFGRRPGKVGRNIHIGPTVDRLKTHFDANVQFHEVGVRAAAPNSDISAHSYMHYFRGLGINEGGNVVVVGHDELAKNAMGILGFRVSLDVNLNNGALNFVGTRDAPRFFLDQEQVWSPSRDHFVQHYPN